MKKIKLGEYIDLLTDYHSGGSYETLKNNTKILYEPNYAVFVRTINFEKNNFYSDLIYCDKKSYDFLEYSHLKENDILMNKIANAGNVYIMPKVNYRATCAMNLFLIRLKNISQKYMYYVMKNSQKYIKSSIHGTNTKTITKNEVRNLEFFIHNTETEQNKIANILSNIDDKIENNNKISAKLEQMAKLIYDYYFVQFDYPDENGKPYKSSGGAMKYNEILKREIPINWEVINSSERLKFTRGIEPGSSEYKSKNYNNVKFYKVGDMLNDANVYIDKKFAELAYAKENDLLVSFDGSVGRIGLGLNGVYSSGIQKISDKNNEISTSILWLMFSSTEFQQIINRYATGSNILHASLSIKYLNFAYNNKIFSKFSKISNPIFNKIIEVKKENQKLSSLRDFLLPMLMNGQVSFKN